MLTDQLPPNSDVIPIFICYAAPIRLVSIEKALTVNCLATVYSYSLNTPSALVFRISSLGSNSTGSSNFSSFLIMSRAYSNDFEHCYFSCRRWDTEAMPRITKATTRKTYTGLL